MRGETPQDHDVTKRSAALVVGDCIGVAHFLVANLVILLGEVTDIFQAYGNKLPGLKFVYAHFDCPMFSLARPMIAVSGADAAYPFFVGELVIVASSLFYGVVVYLFVSAFLYYFMD